MSALITTTSQHGSRRDTENAFNHAVLAFLREISSSHGARYADYSHGIRLVYQTVWIDGHPHDIFDALNDPHLAPLFTDEGIIAEPRALLSAVLE